MKGILKIYHPDETLKYEIDSTYCKPIYSNSQHFLEVEIVTSDSLDHVEDDSLQYQFPQIRMGVYDYPLENNQLKGKTFTFEDSDEESFSEMDLFGDDDAFLYENELAFDEDKDGNLALVWKGTMDDFYTSSDEPISFKLQCDFKPEKLKIVE